MSQLEEIRSRSLQEAGRLGYQINGQLPLLGDNRALRSKRDLTARILCLTAVVAAAWGYPRKRASQWLKHERLFDELSESEKRFLNDGTGELEIRWRVEALWALAWCAGLVKELDFGVECSDTLVQLLPDLRSNEASEPYYQRVVVRDHRSITLSAISHTVCIGQFVMPGCTVKGQRVL
jgi:hypothetical protein